jgi:tetratricopeptide (TPR) repeat protein
MKKTLITSTFILSLIACSKNIEAKTALQYFERGVELLNKQKTADAIKEFDEAIQKDPNNAMFWDRRGAAHFSIQNYMQAVNDYTMAIRLSPQMGFYYTERALAFVALGNHSAAVADLIAAAQLGEPEAQKVIAAQIAANNVQTQAYQANLRREIDQSIAELLGFKK